MNDGKERHAEAIEYHMLRNAALLHRIISSVTFRHSTPKNQHQSGDQVLKTSATYHSLP